MFLVDKYYNLNNIFTFEQRLIDKILNSFKTNNILNVDNLENKSNKEFINILGQIEKGTWRYSNFQHLIVYGSINSNKENIVNLLLQKIYGTHNIECKDIEYTINGYGNTKTKVNIKQSKYHLIIEPNSNGFDKYLIQEIIQDYAKTELLNILKYKKLFKVVVINKIDNLSYYAQTSLRRTMEKYSDLCKFIFICDQLSKIIEPLRSRCLLIRSSLASEVQILDSILKISEKEKIDLPMVDYAHIIENSENKINTAIWLLELKKMGIPYNNRWDNLINEIVYLLLDEKNYENYNFYKAIKYIRELFYNLFITNIPTQTIIRNIMIKILENINGISKQEEQTSDISQSNELKLKNHIIEITSIFEQRLSQGTRHIIHFEAFIIRLFYIFSLNHRGLDYKYTLDQFEN
jgi:replication factor C subunit 3/5